MLLLSRQEGLLPPLLPRQPQPAAPQQQAPRVGSQTCCATSWHSPLLPQPPSLPPPQPSGSRRRRQTALLLPPLLPQPTLAAMC